MARTADNLTFGDSDGGRRRDVRRKQRATLAGVAVNLPLGLIKIAAGYFGRSQALLADGVHSLSDLISDAIVFAAVRFGAKSADHDHPYGHARIETAAMMFVALLLASAGFWIVWDAFHRLAEPGRLLQPGWPALAIALLSLTAKEGLYWYTMVQSRRTRSPLMAANAWHHRSDAASSGLAVLAIAGSMAGLPYLDAAGAILIAVMLTGIGARYAWDSLRELVDTGLRPDRIALVREQIAQVPGVRRMRRLRTRTMGGRDAFADVGVLVDPYISLTEAHRISEAITERLVAHVDEIADICIHIEPDGHADVPAAFDLPLRDVMLDRLRAAWSHMPIAAHIERVTLHYLDDAVDAEILLPLEQAELAGSASAIRTAFAEIAARVDGVRSIRPLFR